MEHNDPKTEEGLNQLIETMQLNGDSFEEINDAITSYRKDSSVATEPLEVEPASEDKGQQKKQKAREYISSAIDTYALGGRAEEKLQPQLQYILGAIDPKWKVEQGISDGSTGTGNYWNMNNITLTNPNGVTRNFNMSNREAMKNEISSFMDENPEQPVNKVKQTKDLRNELERAFTDPSNPAYKPSLFNDILEDENIDLQAKARRESNPEEYLAEKVKEHIGGFGWWGDRNVGEDGVPLYNELSNADIENAVVGMFDTKVYEHKTNIKNNRQTSKEIAIASAGGDLREWQDDDRQTSIGTYAGSNLVIAGLVEDLNHGDLDTATWDATYKKYTTEKDKVGRTHHLIDFKTGKQIITEDQEYANRLAEELGYAALDTQAAKADYKDITDLNELQNEYERSVLALSAFNAELDEPLGWTSLYTPEGSYMDWLDPKHDRPENMVGGELIRNKTPEDNRGQVLKTLRDYVTSVEDPEDWKEKFFEERIPDGYTREEWINKVGNLREDMLDYNTDHEALKSMYLLNEGILDTEEGYLKTAAKAAVTPFIELVHGSAAQGISQNFFGSTHSEKLDKISAKYDELGLDKSEKEIEYAERDVLEQSTEGIAGSVRLVAEIVGVGKVFKAVEGAAGLTTWINYLNSPRYARLGQTFSAAKVGAMAKGSGLGVESFAAKYGLKQIGVGSRNYGASMLYSALHEGLVFETVTRLDTGGEESGFLGGATFGAVGKVMGGIAPGLVKNGRLKDFDTKGIATKYGRAGRINVNTRKLFEAGVIAPVSFTSSMEAAEAMDAIYEDAMGHKEFSRFVEEQYGDYGAIGSRLIVNGLTGFALGLPNHLKSFSDFKSVVGLRRTKGTAKRKLEQLGISAGIQRGELFTEAGQNSIQNNLSPKDLKEYYKHLEVYSNMTQRIRGAQKARGYLDPLRADSQVAKEMESIVKDNAKEGIETVIEVVNNDRLKPGQEPIEGVDANGNKTVKQAEIITEPGGKKKTYRFNAHYYTPEVKGHEVSHDYFETRFGKDAMFTSHFMGRLGPLAEKIELERTVTEAEAKKLYTNSVTKDSGLSKVEARTGRNMTLLEAIKLKDFDIESPVNNQRISQWELFSHIAEQIGNKNNYFKIRDSHGFEGLGELIKDFGKRGNQKYDLTTEKEVVRWFRDYMHTVGKGQSPRKLFEELDSVIDYGQRDALAKERKEQANREGRTSDKGETYSSEPLDVGTDVKINNPKVLAKDVQQEYEEKIANAENKEAAFRDLMDPGRRSSHYDPRYPVVGNKIGPLIDIAINSYNKTIPERYRIDLRNRSFDGERAEFVTDIAYADTRGLSDIFNKYTPVDKQTGNKQMLATWVVGQVRLRAQEIKGRGIDRRSESRAAEKEGVVISGTDISEINMMFEDVGAGMGKIERGETLKEGIRLNDFNWKRGEVEAPMPPSSIEAIKTSAKNTFKDMSIDKLDSYMNVTTSMRSEVRPEVDALFGFVEGAKPKENVAAGNKFINDNATMLYEAMHLTSNPEFYENTNAAKTIFRDFYKDTGVKYKTSELSAEEAARTNARANKFEKLPTTAETVERFVETVTTGRDAGTILKKHATYKDMLAQVLGGQNFRDIVDIKTEVGRDFIENEVPNIENGANKIEVLKAELAFRKLKGATPEALASDVFEIRDEIMELYKGIDFAKQLHPGFHMKRIVESNPRYIDFFDKAYGGVDSFIENGMGYSLKDLDIKTWTKYAGAQRKLSTAEQLTSKVVAPRQFEGGWPDVIKYLNKEFPELNTDGRLLTEKDIRGWYTKPGLVKHFNTELNAFYNTLPIELARDGGMSTAIGFQGHKFVREVLMAGSVGKVQLFERIDASGRDKFLNELSGSGENGPEYLNRHKIVDNGVLKLHINKKLDLPKYKNIQNSPELQLEFASEIKDYLTRKGKNPDGSKITYDQTVKANQDYYIDVQGRLFDFYKNHPDKVGALNFIMMYYQQQTNLGKGSFRGLATHNAISIRKGAKHSEHDLQLMTINGNALVEMVSNGGSKAKFKENFDPLALFYKQSIIDKSIQEKYDSKEYGSSKGYDFDITTESGKYMWLRDKALAATTLDLSTGKTYDKLMSDVIGGAKGLQTLENVSTDMLKNTAYASESLSGPERLEAMKVVDKALANGRKRNAERKGMSTWDFDDTLAHTKSDVLFTAPDGKKGKLNAAEFAEKGSEMLEQGYNFDFSEFNKVTGGKPGPFLEKALERAKKFGTKDQFILTARAPEAAPAIREFLEAQGLDIPLENIVGLGNSAPEAKARWMLERFAEGYNDMYFADDAMQNVKAVRDVLDQLDIKSNVQQARRLASDNLDMDINEMIERGSGIGAVKVFSTAKAKMLGRRRFPKSLVVPGAQDFMGLMYNFVGEGKQGNKDIKFFEDNMVAPFARATKVMNEARQKSSEDLKRLYKDIPSVKKKLNKILDNSAFTHDQAIRAYLWEKAGYEIPGLSARDLKQMTDVVKGDAELMAFADGLTAVSKGGYVEPGGNWIAETIVSDLFNLNNRANRSEFLAEWIENKNIIFSEKNLNKIEATQGSNFREALEDMLYRIETGSNRPKGSNRLVNAHMNFINGSVGATMFLNMRSAALQTISATNYLNWKENNPVKAAAAFGNQKQYWKDFSMIWNSPMLKQRRAGLEYNVQEAELAAAMAGQKNKAKAAMAWLIKKGFSPTQVADSFAIAAGGSTYYRNRLKMYEKQGLSKTEAENQSWLDFQETTEKAQQSSRADLISQQQASPLGRTILAWANTPMQYMRIQEKAARDIINKRGDFKSNVSKIAYYGVIQSLVFASLQSALFSYGLDEEEDIDGADFIKTVDRITNTVIDGQLRGMGVGGAAVSTIKNTILEFNKQELKATDDSFYSEPDHVRTILQLTSYSPVVGSKLKKLYSASNTWNYNRDVIQHMGFDLQNPAIEAGANVIEATTNIPVARLVRKIDNLREVADSENQNWQRVAALGGYSRWDIGLENEAINEAKKEVKAIKATKAEERKKVKKAEKAVETAEKNEAIEEVFLEDQRREIQDNKKDVTCAAVTSSGNRCGKAILDGQSYCTIHEKVEKNATGKKTQCKHIKENGEICKVQTSSKSGYCYYHD